MSMYEMLETLPELKTADIKRIESRILNLYRERWEGIIFDDEYGVWTEEDQVAKGSEALDIIEREAGKRENPSEERSGGSIWDWPERSGLQW